jgi:hypothetical protein
MLAVVLLAWIVLDPAPGIFVRTEADPAAASLASTWGAWEDGTVVGTDASGRLVRSSPDGTAGPLTLNAPLVWVLPEDVLVAYAADGTYQRSTDRGDTWEVFTLPDLAGAQCCFVQADGSIVGTGAQGGPWEFFVSDDAGRTWETGTVEGVQGALVAVAEGKAVVLDASGAVVRWDLPDGTPETVPNAEAWQWYDGPRVESPEGVVLLGRGSVHEPYGALPWAWTTSWDPGGSASDVGVIYALALANTSPELLGFGWDGRLRMRTPTGVVRTRDPVPSGIGGRAEVLAGPGCARWTWPTPFDAPEGNAYVGVTLTNAASVPVRVVRGNCQGWCEDPGETRAVSAQVGYYLGAISEDGVCHALWQVDAPDLSVTVEDVGSSATTAR